MKTLDGEHTLKNGKMHTIAGFTPGGNIRLDNGWLVSKDAGHFRHGFVETSIGSQGRTVQRVLLGMSAASTGAMNQEQMYVSLASRGTEQWLTPLVPTTRRRCVPASSAARASWRAAGPAAASAGPRRSRRNWGAFAPSNSTASGEPGSVGTAARCIGVQSDGQRSVKACSGQVGRGR